MMGLHLSLKNKYVQVWIIAKSWMPHPVSWLLQSL